MAIKLWLKERLGLKISEEKSQITNLRKQYSEFLGFKIKANKKLKDSKNNHKYVATEPYRQ